MSGYPEPQGYVDSQGRLPAQQPQGPDWGFGTGAWINLVLTTGRWNASHAYRPGWAIDGRRQLGEWGSIRIPVAPGRHRVSAGLAVSTAQDAAMDVQVRPGQELTVYYTPGLVASFRGNGGSMGLQPVKPRVSGTFVVLMVALLVPLLVVAVLVVFVLVAVLTI